MPGTSKNNFIINILCRMPGTPEKNILLLTFCAKCLALQEKTFYY
jgi:hypothetical protein